MTQPQDTPGTILDFWFGANPDDGAVVKSQSRLWWGKRPGVDAEIKQRFGSWVARAAAGELDTWLASPPGRLALILLCDQFPRNIYRGTARAFAFDALARGWCAEGLAVGADRALRPVERAFFYLPLEHVESLADQDRAVALFTALAAEVDDRLRPHFDGFLDYARRHRAVIARFGRFPHRNRLLGRESTTEEAAFLRQPGSTF